MTSQLKEAIVALLPVLEKKEIEGYSAEELELLLKLEREKEEAYAYFYHHVFRARLCTIQGLVDVYNITVCQIDQKDLVTLISKEANRLLTESKHLEA